MDRTYNGWTNRATWLVNVWFNPESRDDVESARYAIEEAEDQLPDFMRDFLCTSEINWTELLEHFAEEEAEVRADVDAYLSGTLAPHRRPSWA